MVRGKSNSYHVYVADWSERDREISFKVGYSLYKRVIPGTSRAVVKSKAGAYGFEWVPDFEIRP